MESIISNEEHCYKCGNTINLEKHHIMNGVGLRDKSEMDGLWVYLCPYCHRIKSWAVHNDQRYDNYLKAKAEKYWILLNDKTLEDWMARYHKNYLELDDDGNIKDITRY